MIEVTICIVGLLWHVAFKWDERHRQDGSSIAAYLKSTQSQTAVSLLATTAAFMVTWQMDWMNPGAALACGYMGNSIAENLANRFKPKE